MEINKAVAKKEIEVIGGSLELIVIGMKKK